LEKDVWTKPKSSLKEDGLVMPYPSTNTRKIARTVGKQVTDAHNSVGISQTASQEKRDRAENTDVSLLEVLEQAKLIQRK
jgi:hypothetical protein